LFKNLIVYRLDAAGLPDPAALQAGLERARFVPCAPTEALSLGWVEPRGEAHAPLLEGVGDQWLLALRFEQKLLPTSVVKRRAEERAVQIEQATGRKPGKKQMKDLRDEAMLDLLPLAFTKQSTVRLWIAPDAGLLMLDAGSSARADAAITALVKAVDGLAPMLLQTSTSPAVAMADWLATGEPPAGFSVDRECELKAADETKSVVRYARHALDIDEVRAHIQGGKMPTRLALTWRGRVSFVLGDAMQLRKISYVDGVFDMSGNEGGFDADAALATGELRRLIPDLIEALGGEPPAPGAGAAVARAPEAVPA
jgi:recombination associated protein RdgC